jgi:hypothetical protein
MTKIVLAVVLTAIPAFAAGVWTRSTLVESRAANNSTPATISPSEMHRAIKPSDLPTQYMRGDFN